MWKQVKWIQYAVWCYVNVLSLYYCKTHQVVCVCVCVENVFEPYQGEKKPKHACMHRRKKLVSKEHFFGCHLKPPIQSWTVLFTWPSFQSQNSHPLTSPSHPTDPHTPSATTFSSVHHIFFLVSFWKRWNKQKEEITILLLVCLLICTFSSGCWHECVETWKQWMEKTERILFSCITHLSCVHVLCVPKKIKNGTTWWRRHVTLCYAKNDIYSLEGFRFIFFLLDLLVYLTWIG